MAPSDILDEENGTVSVDFYQSKTNALQDKIKALEEQLRYSQVEHEEKDKEIEMLQAKLKSKETFLAKNSMLEESLKGYLLARAGGDKPKAPSLNMASFKPKPLERHHSELKPLPKLPKRSFSAGSLSNLDQPPPTSEVADKIQQWLFIEGGDLRSVESLLTKYCDFCRSMRLPLDRLCVKVMMMKPQASAYEWKWELWEEFDDQEVPHSVFEETYNGEDEPFAKLRKGEVSHYRLKGRQDPVPKSCHWYSQKRYQDYYVLPMYHCGEFKGTISWSTTSSRGFSSEHIQTFEQSITALSTVLRCHTNDMAMKTLMSRLEQEVTDQTAELANANKSLAEANRQIIRQSQSQLRNFAMMSHEIRTPLNCIIGVSNLLLENDLAADMKESVEMITSSGDLLLAVVDDVLDYSKLASGNVDTKISTTNLSTTINAVVNTVTTKALQSGVELRTHFSSDLPVELETDGRRLQQILYNLLGNAVKFGREGKYVDFSMDIVSRDITMDVDDIKSTDRLVRFTVKDFGKGIRSEEISKIFEPFKQADTNEPAHGGTGLGLAITRQLVRVLGGTISVESEYGSWCEFVVLLPMDPTKPINRRTLRTEVLDYVVSTEFVPLEDGQNTDYDDASTTTFESSFSTQASSSIMAHSTSGSVLQTAAQHSIPATVTMDGNGSLLASYSKLICPEDQMAANIVKQEVVEGNSAHSSLGESIHSKVRDDGVPGTSAIDTSTTPELSGSFEFDKVKVLIAEDNKINQKVLSRSLHRIGVQSLDIVNNGKEAVEAYGNSRYDVIFMDLQMPIMDGLEATKIIASERTKKNEIWPKVVFLTAHALNDYQEKAAEAGGDGFISKPFKMNIIKELIVRLMTS